MITLSRQVKTFLAAERTDSGVCWVLDNPFDLFRPIGCAIGALLGEFPARVAFNVNDKPWPSSRSVPIAPFQRAYVYLGETGMFPAESPFYFPSMRGGEELQIVFDVPLDYAEVIFWGMTTLEADSRGPLVQRAKDDSWKKEMPIDEVIFCPECKKQHLDVGEFETRVHRTHKCDETPEGPHTGCGFEWKEHWYPTRGVTVEVLLERLGTARVRLQALANSGRAK